MDQLLTYLHSPELTSFIFDQAPSLVLLFMAVAVLALAIELRLPLPAYLGLPSHSLKQLSYRWKLNQAPPTWGVCVNQATGKPLSVVAIELLDQSTHKVLAITYSDKDGRYGFPLKPGRYLLRATKGNYKQPSFLNPDSIEVRSLNNSFVVEVAVLNHQVAPVVDLELVSRHAQSTTSIRQMTTYLQMALFQIGHGLILICAIIALIGLWLQPDLFYAVILSLCLLLLFIKLYILQLIGTLTRNAS